MPLKNWCSFTSGALRAVEGRQGWQERDKKVIVVHWVAALAARLFFSCLPAISPNTGEMCVCSGGGGGAGAGAVIHHSVLVMS